MLKQWRRLTVVALMGFAAACNLAEPSARSNQLERMIVPGIEDWSSGGAAELKLSDLSEIRAADAVCLVTEYQKLDDIESTDIVGEITEYHSSFGNHVPENRVALVVVSAKRAHAAVLPSKGVFYNILARTKCVGASKAILRRNVDPLTARD